MDMKTRLMLALLLGVAAGLAQVPSPQAATFVALFGPARRLAEKPIVKEPYSGERKKDEAPNARPDLEWRDSAGRTRIERYFLISRPVPGTTLQWHSLTTIVDPVAGVQYVLDTENKIAHRQVLPPAVKAPPSGSNPSPWLIGTDGCCGVLNSPLRPADDSRDFPSISPLESLFPAGLQTGGGRHGKKLGTRIIEGIKAEGIRYDDKGEMAGGVPASRTAEVWTSPELHVRLLYSYAFLTGAPRIASTERLTQISRSEPDPALFQVPPDYRIVNEAAGFAISIPR
jgi:hypothetical protein